MHRWLGVLFALLFVISFVFLSERFPRNVSFAGTSEEISRVIMPLILHSAAPWQPTATPSLTPTRTSTPTRTATPTATATATPALAIRALQPLGSDEFVEIHNAGPGPQTLTGWRLRSVVGEQWYTFPWGVVLNANAWLRVHSGPQAFDAPPYHYLWTTGYIWNNAGDVAELYDDHNRLVDRWRYGSAP